LAIPNDWVTVEAKFYHRRDNWHLCGECYTKFMSYFMSNEEGEGHVPK